jgi:hypothetical protein
MDIKQEYRPADEKELSEVVSFWLNDIDAVSLALPDGRSVYAGKEEDGRVVFALLDEEGNDVEGGEAFYADAATAVAEYQIDGIPLSEFVPVLVVNIPTDI